MSEADRREETSVDRSVRAVGFMPQLFVDGAWRDWLNGCVDQFEVARKVTAATTAAPVRIVERVAVDVVVEMGTPVVTVKAARELLGITRRDARRLVAEIRRLEGL